MSTSIGSVAAASFSPSELVLLNGERFAAPARFGNNVQLLHTDAKASAEQLGQSVLAVALLACEQAGSASLEVSKKKALMGLRKLDAVFVVPAGGATEWPAHTLESELLRLARELQADGSNEVSNILYLWLGRDSSVPWYRVVELIQQGLVARGYLEQHTKKKLKVFSTSEYVLPESTASLAAQGSVEHLQQLQKACEQDRPDLWKLLQKQIKDAIKRRTEDYDSDF